MIERTFVEQGIRNIELDKYLRTELERAGFTHSEIVKTPLVTRIVVNVTSPGLAIGKGGQTIRQLTEEIKRRFKIDNPQLEIREIQNPNLDAQVVVDKMAKLISRGFSWRSVVYRTLRDIMQSGAQGAEIIAKGVIAGKGQRKRKQRIAEGYLKKVGDQVKLVEFGKSAATTKIGNIGLKVRIVRPDVKFPDKINMAEFVPKKATEETEKALVAEMETGSEEKESGETAAKKEKKPKKEKKETVKEKKEAKETDEKAEALEAEVQGA